MGNDVRTVVREVTRIAKEAAGARAVKFGVVLSRNPDGTLNVDPKDGGCARQMGSANVRLGDLIPMGTEPALGTVTSLAPDYFPIPAVPSGCPSDPRETPEIPFTQPSFYGAMIANFIRSWSDRDTIYPTFVGFPLDHSAGSTGVSTTTSSILGSQVLMPKYAEYGVPLVNVYFCYRNFIRFDRPPGVFTGLTLEFSVNETNPGNDDTQFGKRWSPDEDSMVVVPAFPATWPPTTADLNAISRDVALGTRSIMTATAFGTNNYGVSIPLNVDAVNAYSAPTDPTIAFCLISGFDFSGAVPPHNLIYPSTNGGVYGPDGYGNNRGNWLRGYVPPTTPTPTDDKFPRLLASIADL